MSQKIDKIACLGEVMIELIADSDGGANLGVAGDTYNTAIYLAQLLPQTQISYITALGQDPYSDRIIAHANAQGLNMDTVDRTNGAMPGLYAIDTDDAGERSFSYWRSASAARGLFGPNSGLDLSCLNGFDLIYLSGISIAILPDTTKQALLDALKAYRAQGGLVAFDSNYRPRLWDGQRQAQDWITAFWSNCDIGLPSLDDEMAIFEGDQVDCITRLQACGVDDGALKRGEDGPVCLSDPAFSAIYKRAEHVVDTTAAGDSFNAGYLAGRVKNLSEADALLLGHNLARHVVQHKGAIVPIDRSALL